MPTQKRERQRENRALARSERDALLRKRRLVRLVTGLVVAAVLAGAALFFAPDAKNKKSTASSKHAASPAPTGPLAPAKAALLPAGCHDDARPQPGPTSLPSPQPNRYAKASGSYHAVIHTNCGDIEMTLDAKQAPKTVNNFVYLADKGFYDALYWHRIVRNFVIQGGDPNGRDGLPPDGPGYTIPDEYPTKSNEYTFGTVAMANSGQPNSGGSQFFVVVHENKNAKGGKRFREPAGLQPRYSIFGKVDPGSFHVLEQIAKTPVVGGTGSDQNEPKAPVFITGISITGH